MSSNRCKIPPITSCLVFFFFFFIFVICGVKSFNFNHTNQTFRPADESKKLNLIREQLKKINKPAVKTIHSSNGDIIDCVLSHKQPAFDHPLLQGQKPLDPPAWPKGYEQTADILEKRFQVWSSLNETCPEGTIPIRRTTEQDLLSGSSIRRLGKKITKKPTFTRAYSTDGHEHAIGFITGDNGYYGAATSMSVWAPQVEKNIEFSLSQVWVTAGSFEEEGDLNTIEAGWKVYGDDNQPRLFTYWTSDGYASTGCYNMDCPGFVHTSKKVALGVPIIPISTYDGPQFEMDFIVWKDPIDGNWWLGYGKGYIVGYWPSVLFTHLRDHADTIQFGGEVINDPFGESHTKTEMGSGHFPEEGFGKAAFFRNLEVIGLDNSRNPVQGLQYFTTKPNCYNTKEDFTEDWGTHFYYGGPGKNPNCP